MGLSVSNAGTTRVLWLEIRLATQLTVTLCHNISEKKGSMLQALIQDYRQETYDRRKDRHDQERALCNHLQCKMLSESVKKKGQ